MMRTRAVLALLILVMGSVGVTGSTVGEETPPLRPPALGLNLGALVRIAMPLGPESAVEDIAAEFYATMGWDGRRGGIEVLLPATYGLLGSEVALDAMLPIFPRWRMGAGVLVRPFSLELSGVRIQAVGGSTAFAVTLGAVIARAAEEEKPLDLHTFIGVRISPW